MPWAPTAGPVQMLWNGFRQFTLGSYGQSCSLYWGPDAAPVEPHSGWLLTWALDSQPGPAAAVH